MYIRYCVAEYLDLEEQINLVRELKKADIDAEYGLNEKGQGVSISLICDSEIGKMNEICKKYGATPVFVKRAD